MLKSENLKRVREMAGLSQVDLAINAGLNKNAGYRIENNIDDPRFSSVLAIAELLDVSLDFLAGRTNDAKAHKALKPLEELAPDLQNLIAAMQRDDWSTVLEMVSNKVRQDFIEKPTITRGKPSSKE